MDKPAHVLLGADMGKQLIRSCSIWRALEVVGDLPTLLILEVSWLGARRFDQYRKQTELLKSLLSDRLSRLVKAGLLEKKLYCESPPRYEYLMTEKGQDLYWVALMMLRCEKLWHEDGKISVELTHKTCGAKFDPLPACGSCGDEIDPTQVSWCEGPGLGWMMPLYSRRRRSRGSDAKSSSLMDQSAQIMGDRWASLIMRSIYTGVNRFDDIRVDTAIATNILSERLNWLTQMGLIRQEKYLDNPPRFEYRLRRKGVDYYHALLMLLRWGDTYYVAPEGPPLVLTHEPCGGDLDAQVVCSHCREPIDFHDVRYKIIAGESDGAESAEDL